MKWMNEDDLGRIYDKPPVPASIEKVAKRLTPDYAKFIQAARFCVVATVGPEGTDASPRGDDGAVVKAIDDRHIALPDWHGNNRIDSLRNILRDGRISLMFLVKGSDNAIRINGTARLTDDETLLESFAHKGKLPRCVIVVQIGEIYFQCARALMRSGLWDGEDHSQGLPTPGEILANMSNGEVGGVNYDAAWPERAAKTMW